MSRQFGLNQFDDGGESWWPKSMRVDRVQTGTGHVRDRKEDRSAKKI